MTDTITSADGQTYTEEQLLRLAAEVKDYQLTHGSLIKLVAHESDSSVPARPVGASVLPSAFPRKLFEEARDLQQLFNELYVRVASDPEWLRDVLEPLFEHDFLVTAFWDIFTKVRDADAIQSVVCGIFRSDYMLHQPSGYVEPGLKQVEMNTYSCAGACHAERVAKMHRHLARLRGLSDPRANSLPTNTNTDSIVQLLKAAHVTYTGSDAAGTPTCVLLPVQPFNFNIADERPIEYGLFDSSVACFRCEWPVILDRTELSQDRILIYKPLVGNVEYEVSVIYYRAGYDPAEYDARGKETRLRLELSQAVKCPDILGHMTNFKSVQAALAQLGGVERFLPDADASRLRRTFMRMHVLDADAGDSRKVAMDPKQAEHYVLKPNLEGGGHNIYRSDIPDFLSQQPEDEWHKYILMQMIKPPESQGTLMMPEDLYHGSVVSELGILGACLWSRERSDGAVKMITNDVAGWTFKTKPAEIDEMSVVKGYGCFDCPLLSD